MRRLGTISMWCPQKSPVIRKTLTQGLRVGHCSPNQSWNPGQCKLVLLPSPESWDSGPESLLGLQSPTSQKDPVIPDCSWFISGSSVVSLQHILRKQRTISAPPTSWVSPSPHHLPQDAFHQLPRARTKRLIPCGEDTNVTKPFRWKDDCGLFVPVGSPGRLCCTEEPQD